MVPDAGAPLMTTVRSDSALLTDALSSLAQRRKTRTLDRHGHGCLFQCSSGNWISLQRARRCGHRVGCRSAIRVNNAPCNAHEATAFTSIQFCQLVRRSGVAILAMVVLRSDIVLSGVPLGPAFYYYGCVTLVERKARYSPWADGFDWRTATRTERPFLYWLLVTFIFMVSGLCLAGALANAFRQTAAHRYRVVV
jgi:hypothetical protein